MSESVPSRRLSAVAEIVNMRGLHARASAKFVETAARFTSEITVTKDGTSVSGRSIMGLMMLGAGMGSVIQLIAEGADAEAAMRAVTELVRARFHEEA